MVQKRRNKKEVCDALKKKRAVYYKTRTATLRALSKGTLTERQRKTYSKRYDKISLHINNVNKKLFKCSVQYEKLNRERQRLQNMVNSMRKQLLSRKIDTKERGDISKRLRETAERLNDVRKLMGMAITISKKGEVEFNSEPEKGLTDEIVPIFEGRETVLDMVKSGDYDNIEINGEMFSIDMQMTDVLIEIDFFVSEVISKQFATKTPMIHIYGDRIKGLIRITDVTIK